MARIGHPLYLTAMDTGIVIVDVVIFFSTSSLRPHRAEKPRELAVSYLISIDKELGQIDFMLWTLIFRPVATAHGKNTGRDPNHAVDHLRFSGAGNIGEQRPQSEQHHATAD